MKRLFLFPFFYLKEIFLGTLLVARDVLSPRQKLAPVLLHFPVAQLTPGQRLLLACLVSMTPGTLSVAEDLNDQTMLIHSLYGADNPATVLRHLQTHYEPFVSQLPI